MILLTVGTQLPFGRLVRAVDAWCAESGRSDVVGQIGDIDPVGYRPRHFEWRAFIPPQALDELMGEAELIIAHAGMGSIISALQHAKPIVIMPRRADLGEHRSDHQLATAARFEGRPGVYVAREESALGAALNGALAHASGAFQALSDYAEPRLTESMRRFILTGEFNPERGGVGAMGADLAVKPKDIVPV